MINNRWNYVPLSEEEESKKLKLSEDLGCSPVLCQLLMQRGITTFEDAKRFFRPQLSDLHDPFLMNDMEKAVERLNHAMRNKNQKILVYGDYDVDGITSTAVFVKYLRMLGVDVVWHLPTREGEGYGLNNDAIAEIVKDNVDFFIKISSLIYAVAHIHAQIYGYSVPYTPILYAPLLLFGFASFMLACL